MLSFGSRLITIISFLTYVNADSCIGRCGENFNSAYTCQCNTHCGDYRDCCNDYTAICLGETCEGRCDANHDSTKSCQCNSHCTTYNDCCPDYNQLCEGAASDACDLSCVAQAMWDADNRITKKTVNYQAETTTSGTSDAAALNFFTSVDETTFQDKSTTYYKFIALLDNYNPNIGQAEDLTTEELAEIDSFMNAVLQTEVMSHAYNYLLTNKYTSSQTNFREQLMELWFNLYSRSSSSSVLDSSGFEHVLVGEQRSTVSGFHNWIQFYLEEKNNRLNYLGYVSKQEPEIVAAKFEWNGRMKTKGSFFIGVSPEFDMAIYSLCAITKPSAICSFTMQGQTIRIQTWDINHKAGLQIGSAYPVL